MLFRSLHLSLRFILPLALVMALFAYAVVPLVNDMTTRWFMRDLDGRAQMLANALHDPVRDAAQQPSSRQLAQLFNRTVQQDIRLYALAYCSADGKLLVATTTYPPALACPPAATSEPANTDAQPLLQEGALSLHVTRSLIRADATYLGQLVLVQETGFIATRIDEAKRYVIALFALLALVISLLSAFIAHLSWQGWMRTVRSILRHDPVTPEQPTPAPREMQPLLGDLRALLHQYNVERQAQEKSPQAWTPEKLRSLLHDELAGDEVLVVSNREPYIHVHGKQGIEVRRPASGLVTAVEPVMRACSGTWIAHGGGDADRETVDLEDRVRVPPKNPAYTLRRVWLSEEEEQGYYYGFANEGLWPLCHIAHVRPVFRSADWEQYKAVNQRFADAVLAEANTDDPVVLVQDYHFALLPAMVREKLPKATIIMFWHIPWPNPESFGICPWREEILEGLLGNTLLGFHTPFHCKNFLETVDRYLETRIEYEASTISYGGALTQVEPYPISIAWPTDAVGQSGIAECHRAVREKLGLPPDHRLAVGIDRLDYTKGIIERMQAVERMFELQPNLIGHFSLLQVAAPSRSSLDEYQHFEQRVRALAARINSRFGEGGPPPILLKIEHHDADQVQRLYRAAEICMVTSLHDGMNLVAKEYIAAREDELGVLILSQFTGAARELHEALIINPYHIEQGAEALLRALSMPELEQRDRMHSMRSLVHDFNVYRWAGRMLLDAARLRRRERITEQIHLHSRKPLRRVV